LKVALMFLRVRKLAQVIRSRRLSRAFFRYRVLAGTEHRGILSPDLSVVIDIGANRGQFSLAVREWASAARVISFEPLPGPASIFDSVFSGDKQITLNKAAIGPTSARMTMHVSKRDDSSSLLPISSIQSSIFPGTEEVATIDVPVGPLQEFVHKDDLKGECMIKLDVQGFEYEALLGCLSMLALFKWVYCECSFVELYAGQKLAPDVIALLADHGLSLASIHNTSYDDSGHCIQADLLFRRPGV
jgi:FkbM family methyltransferase